jgi:hypothetical protein
MNAADLFREVYLENLIVHIPSKCRKIEESKPVEYEPFHDCSINGCWNAQHLMTTDQLIAETNLALKGY